VVARLSDAVLMPLPMTTVGNQEPVAWFHQVMDDDVVTFRAGRLGDRLVANWPGLATLACAPDGSDATFRADADAPPGLINKLRNGAVFALLRDLGGSLSLHASAVAIEDRAVLFIGTSGAGKSTVAAALCLRYGGHLLADDVATLEITSSGVDVLPHETEHWLTRDSIVSLGIPLPDPRPEGPTAKLAVKAQRVAGRAYRLSLGIVLRSDATASVTTLPPLRGGDAAHSLLGSTIRFDVENGAARCRELEQVMSVYDRVPFLQLVRGHDPATSVASIVLKAMSAGTRT